MSIRILDYILEGLRQQGIDCADPRYGGLSATDMIFIYEMILGTRTGADGKPLRREGRGADKAFFFDIINNLDSGLDVDKVDYLGRDQEHARGERTSFDRLTMLARVCKVLCLEHERMVHHQTDSSGYRLAICLPEKAAGEALDTFRARAVMHDGVYQHRVVIAEDCKMTRILHLASDAVRISVERPNGTVQSYTLAECVLEPEAFLKLTDGGFVLLLLFLCPHVDFGDTFPCRFSFVLCYMLLSGMVVGMFMTVSSS
jgi:hypothetical protein